MKFTISQQWDGKPTGHEPIEVTLTSAGNGVTMKVEGPFFNDPSSPSTRPGEPAPQLWDYEGIYVSRTECEIRAVHFDVTSTMMLTGTN